MGGLNLHFRGNSSTFFKILTFESPFQIEVFYRKLMTLYSIIRGVNMYFNDPCAMGLFIH